MTEDWAVLLKLPEFYQQVIYHPDYIDCHLSPKGKEQVSTTLFSVCKQRNNSKISHLIWSFALLFKEPLKQLELSFPVKPVLILFNPYWAKLLSTVLRFAEVSKLRKVILQNLISQELKLKDNFGSSKMILTKTNRSTSNFWRISTSKASNTRNKLIVWPSLWAAKAWDKNNQMSDKEPEKSNNFWNNTARSTRR